MPVLLNRPDTAAGIKPVHEARQVPALVQAHADGQAAVEVGLADDVPAAPGEMLLVAGTGFQQEIELAVVLETDDVLATQAACDLAQDAALLLDDRRSGKEGVLCDKDSLVHSDDVWSVTNMRNVRHTASGRDGKYAEGRADMCKRLLNYILCIRFFIEVHSIVSASRFFHIPTYLRVVIECQSRFFPFFPAFSRNCPDYFLHTSGSSSFRSLSDLGAR